MAALPFVYAGISDERDKDDAIRPGIPYVLIGALIFWLASALAYEAVFGLSQQACLLIIGVVCLLIVGIMLLMRTYPRKLKYFLLVLFAVVGVACSSVHAFQYANHGEWYQGEYESLLCEAVGDSVSSGSRTHVTALCFFPDGGKANVDISFPSSESFLCGERFVASCDIKAISHDKQRQMWERAVVGQTFVTSYDSVPHIFFDGVIELRKRAIENFASYTGEEAGLFQALVCGYRQTLRDSGMYDSCKMLGLAHIVAVSGAHLAIVVGVFEWLLLRIGVSQRIRIGVLVSFILIYLVFAGLPVSALRSAFMVICSLLGSCFKRRGASLSSLAICIIVFIAHSPETAVSTSFFLSASSTLGIVLFAGLVQTWFDWMPEKLKAYVGEPLSLTVASSITTRPFSVALFAQYPVYALAANIIATPLFTINCISGLVASVLALVCPAGAPFILGVVANLCVPFAAFIEFGSSLPYASISIDASVPVMIGLSMLLSVGLWVLWPQLTFRRFAVCVASLGLACLLLVFPYPFAVTDEIVMLDVGQGDAFLIRSGTHSVLIDTGTNDAQLRQELARKGVRSLDAVLITHPDDDHCGSLLSLSQIIQIGAVYAPDGMRSCSCKSCSQLRDSVDQIDEVDSLEGLRVGDHIPCGNFDFHVVWPENLIEEGGNADSLGILLKADCDKDNETDWTAFFCGDAGSEQIETLIDRGLVGSVDVFKVGHHGSRFSISEKIVHTLKPSIALVSAGAHNRYGHPHQETIELLESVSTEILRTDEQGTVEIRFYTDHLEVR